MTTFTRVSFAKLIADMDTAIELFMKSNPSVSDEHLRDLEEVLRHIYRLDKLRHHLHLVRK